MADHIHDFLTVWFGETGTADLPNSNRTAIWFGEDDTIKKVVFNQFEALFNQAKAGLLNTWANEPRGRLALIILFDQFPRHFYQRDPNAFAYDAQALKLALDGMAQQQDQLLTLIERVFFYMPLVHTEELPLQEQSLKKYQELVALALSETTSVYQLFLAYAFAHYKIIKEFGRFPQRNAILKRPTTEAEHNFLKKT